MSFRSRSHAKPVAPPRRRSSSLTRNSATSSSYTAPSSSARPYSSIHGSALNFSSPQNNYMYGSNQNLRMSGTDYYGNGSDYRRNSYTQPNGTLKFPMTTMSTGGSSSSSSAAYTSPYKDRYPNSYLSNGSSGYTSAYKDRGYYNPYTSYDNGVTTASLSIPMANSGSSVKRDYAPIRSSNLLSASSNGLGGSNTSLMGNGQSINDKVANIGRSQSLREHERKNRSRKCKEAAKVAVPDTSVPYDYEVAAGSGSSSNLSVAQKSLSVLSLHSEGYESGNESRSRAESLASSALGDANDDGEFVDYKALYEAAKAENERLRGTLKNKDQDLAAAKSALERLTAAATKSSLSENEKREKRAMERKISEMEEELKQMDVLKTENQRLKDENGALIRVISKLSK